MASNKDKSGKNKNKSQFSMQTRNNGAQSESDLDQSIDMFQMYTILEDLRKNVLTKSEIDGIIEKMRALVMNELQDKIINEVRVINGHLTTLSEKYEKIIDDNEQLKNENKNLKCKVEDLESQITISNKNANKAIQMANYNEQYSRKNNIRILGLPENQNEF